MIITLNSVIHFIILFFTKKENYQNIDSSGNYKLQKQYQNIIPLAILSFITSYFLYISRMVVVDFQVYINPPMEIPHLLLNNIEISSIILFQLKKKNIPILIYHDNCNSSRFSNH